MTPEPVQRLGDFEIVREVGRGGMGIVYEARQISLNRKVALKVLSAGLGLTDKAVQRFRREAEAAARLHHTNIVPVYATGEDQAIHYCAMELIEGPSLDHVIRQLKKGDAPLPGTPTAAPSSAECVPSAPTGPYIPVAPGTSSSGSSTSTASGNDHFDRIARMIAEVADGLEYAHRQGVIHRDIKPSNLLLSPEGRLSINDFGLARVLEQPGMTLTGEFVGTPMYMSPEQITAGRAPLDHRTDIYSLGATLYELLTLQPPFAAERRDQVIAQIMHKEPRPPRQVNRRVPVDLETICLKALEKDPDRRYQTGKEMAEDLRRYVNRFAISARRSGPLTRAKKWAKRNPALAVAGLLVLVTAAAAGFFAWQAQQDRQRLRAEQRQAAMDTAILEALSGDAPAALDAILDAENKGAEAGQLNLLRGAVEVYRGRPKEALLYLDQADRQLPDSVAVKALRAKAYLEDSQLDRIDELLTAVERVQPRTSEDYLFLGLVQSDTDPVAGLRTFDGMLSRHRQTPLGRLARAHAQTALAVQTGRAEDAEQALDDLRGVGLPDNPLLLADRVDAGLTAAHGYGPNDPRRDGVLKQAERDVARLATFRDNAVALLSRCRYFEARGDDDRLLEAIHQARGHAAPGFLTTLEVTVLYRRKQYAEALHVLRSTAPAADWIQKFQEAVVLATLPERRAEAEQAFQGGIAMSRQRGALAMTYLCAFQQVLGPAYTVPARREALDLDEHFSHLVPNLRNHWYHHLLAYHAGLLDEGELLQKAGDNHFNQCEAQFYIGLRRLGEGKRQAAKACFQRSLDTGVTLFGEYGWSRAFLPHIDDPDWLPWIPVKE
jgi:serine/threonine protein kinase